MNIDTLSMLYPIRLPLADGAAWYIGTGPSEGTLWGAWQGHLWSILDPATDRPWWVHLAGKLPPYAGWRYLEGGYGYLSLGEVEYAAK